MLTTEMRQSLQGLIFHPDISSVKVTDFRSANEVESYVDIHVADDADRIPILSHLHFLLDAEFKQGEPNKPRDDGKQTFPYKLIIEGCVSILSNIFFTENKEGWQEVEIKISQYEMRTYMFCKDCRKELGLIQVEPTKFGPTVRSVEEKLFEVISEIVAGQLDDHPAINGD